MEDKKIIVEELSRIKNLMGYDRSKTLNENINEADGIVDTVYKWLLPSGDIVKGTDIKGKIPKGSKLLNGVNAEKAVDAAGDVGMVSSLVGGGGETAAVAGTELAAIGGTEVAAVGTTVATGGVEAAAGTFLGLGPVGWTILGVAGLASLGYWAATKDDKMSMIKNLFGICQSSEDKDKWKRYMNDVEVKRKSGILYHSMEGLGTDEDKIYGVFKSFKSPGDFCAVSEKYEKTFNESLLDALDGDFDYGWENIANPLVEMTKKYAQTESEEYCKTHVEECAENLKLYCEKNPKDPNCNVLKTSDVSTGEYMNCNGEYHKGCKGPKIVQLQRCLGVSVDGKFGDETEKALESKTKSKTFKDEDVKIICGKK